MFRSKVYRPFAAILAIGALAFATAGCSYDLPSLRGDSDQVSGVVPVSATEADQIETGSIPASPTPGNLTVVQVKPGDSLYSIARAHNLDWRDLATANQLADPYDISDGQTLMLPAAQN